MCATGLDGHIELETLRDLWRPISPWSYLERARERKTLLVYAKYDLTFPVDLSRKLVDEFRRREHPDRCRGAAVRALQHRAWRRSSFSTPTTLPVSAQEPVART